jgi:hypothetical protein
VAAISWRLDDVFLLCARLGAWRLDAAPGAEDAAKMAARGAALADYGDARARVVLPSRLTSPPWPRLPHDL